MPATLYEADFYAWANTQAALLRSGNLSAADIENIAEEIESMGKTQKQEMVNRLAVLLLHLLKWQYQADRQGSSWRATIRVQRRDLARLIRDNPSLKSHQNIAIEDAYGDALINASEETGITEEAFPETCPWSFEQIMDPNHWPM